MSMDESEVKENGFKGMGLRFYDTKGDWVGGGIKKK